MDKEGIMHGFFGEDWRKGVGPVHECERRNYLFTAKSVGWAKLKCQYDMSPHESVPYIKPLQDVQLAEIESAEKMWSQWLAMEDWMPISKLRLSRVLTLYANRSDRVPQMQETSR
jgi:hypothetical protein